MVLTLEPVATDLPLLEQINAISKRVDSVDSWRLEKIFSSQRAEIEHIIKLLPLLIHLNIEGLHGYVPNAPCGVFDFQISDFQKKYLQDIGITCDLPNLNCAEVSCEGIFLMGSSGSVVQNEDSDLDVWICYSDEINSYDLAIWRQKLDKLQAWSRLFGVKSYFYLVNPTKFQNLMQSGRSDEYFGSIHRLLLLDEFYRSAIRLAGKRLLWLHLPHQNNEYQQAKAKAVEEGLVCENFLDFGDFIDFSNQEVLFALLWQLHKALRNPYKSLLKIILLEMYSNNFAQFSFLSKQLQKMLTSHEAVASHFDAYLMMLEAVTEYLTKHNYVQRLANVQSAFFIKASCGKAVHSWRKDTLQKLANDWGFTENYQKQLQNIETWDLHIFAREQQMLLSELLTSYQNCLYFVSKSCSEITALPYEIEFLMANLHNFFSSKPNKIPLYFNYLQNHLSQKNVLILESKVNKNLPKGWYLYSFDANCGSYKRKYLQHNENLVYLLAWGYFNRILTTKTDLDLQSVSADNNLISKFIEDLTSTFPLPLENSWLSVSRLPEQISSMMLVVDLLKPCVTKYSQHNLLNFENISLIYINAGNELMVHSFSGANSLLNVLKLITNKIQFTSETLPKIKVCYYGDLPKESVEDELVAIINRCISVKKGVQHIKSLENHKNPEWQKEILGKSLDCKNLEKSEFQEIINKLNEFASISFWQYFFECTEKNCNIYVLDENNNLSIYQSNNFNLNATINKLMYQHLVNINLSEDLHFRYPRFYNISKNQNLIRIALI